MIQPFMQFRSEYIDRLIKMERTFLVAQTFRDGETVATKVNILLTDYDLEVTAKTHLGAVKANDYYASIIDLKKEKHLETLNAMLKPESKYLVYWSVVKNKEALQKQINIAYKEKMKNYISRHTNWRLSRDTTLYTQIEVKFGELYVNVKYGSQRLNFKFAELSNY